jgi:hypothetical protein
MPPLASVCIHLFLAFGVGPAFYVAGTGDAYNRELFIMQATALASYPFLAFFYWWFSRRVPAVTLPGRYSPDAEDFYRALQSVALFCFWFAMAMAFVGAVTGVADKGYGGEEFAENRNGYWTVFAIFARFAPLGFILFPLLVRYGTRLTKLTAWPALAGYFLLAFASGSRGMVLLPLVGLIIGYYTYGVSPRRTTKFVALAIPFALLLIPVMGRMRGSQAFYWSRAIDLSARYQTAQDAIGEISSEDSGSTLRDLGANLIGVSDELVYRLTPDVQPFVGWQGVEALRYVFIPQTLRPGTPTLGDGSDIVATYVGQKFRRSNFTITFQADMYRRFGWTGVIAGTLGLSILFGAAIGAAFKTCLFHDKLLGYVVLLLCASFYNTFPFSTFLNTCQIWLYDFPKYVLAIVIVHKLIMRRSLAPSRRSGSALPGTYAGRARA